MFYGPPLPLELGAGQWPAFLKGTILFYEQGAGQGQ